MILKTGTMIPKIYGFSSLFWSPPKISLQSIMYTRLCEDFTSMYNTQQQQYYKGCPPTLI